MKKEDPSHITDNLKVGCVCLGRYTFISDFTAPIKLGPKHKNKDSNGKGWSPDQFSES